MGKFAEAINGLLDRLKRSEGLLTETQNQVSQLRDELAKTKEELQKTRQRLSDLELQGDFSPPMTKKEMAAVLRLKPRAFETFAKSHGLRRSGRQQFQIRLNGMDAKTRRKFE
jgi:predicted nuclease with TOPRIM domain